MLPKTARFLLTVAILVIILAGSRLHDLYFHFASFSGLSAIFYICGESNTQWLWVLCQLPVLGWILLSRCRGAGAVVKAAQAALFAFIVCCIAAHFVQDSFDSPCSDLLVLVTSITLGHLLALLDPFQCRLDKSRGRFANVHTMLVFALAMTSVMHNDNSIPVYFHGHLRLTGPWANPNVFGMMMGVGLILCASKFIGMAIDLRDKQANTTRRAALSDVIIIAFFGLSFAALLIGLLRSYSRGAWCGTFCGMVVLGTFSMRSWGSHWWKALQIARSGLKLGALCIFVLCVWFGDFMEGTTTFGGRVLSIVNANDFSSRNRIAAYIGNLQMIAARPLFGYGWNATLDVYSGFYMKRGIVGGEAILLNDYLQIATNAGVLALGCFVSFLVMVGIKALRQAEQFANGPAQTPKKALASMWGCLAAITVLCVGFWFNGGLFKMPVAPVFWTLVAWLSSISDSASTETKRIGLARQPQH